MKTHALMIALALSSRLTGLAAVTDGLAHHWNFDEGRDWHDSPLGSVASITHALDLAGGWHATLVNLAGSNWASGHEFTCLRFASAACAGRE